MVGLIVRIFSTGAVAIAALLLLPGIFPAAAKDPVTLDGARIAHIAGLNHLEGRNITGDGLRGRPVIVSFFASWCPPCNTEFEHLRLLHEAHAADGLTVIAINQFEDFTGFSDDGKRLARFLRRHEPVFTILKGTDETAALFGSVKRIPTVFVFDRQGVARLHFVHEEGAKKSNPGLTELRHAVRDALGIGAAERPPFLPESPESVTKRSPFSEIAKVTR